MQKGQIKVRTIKIILVDDYEMAHTGLRSLLENNQDIEVVGEAGNGENL